MEIGKSNRSSRPPTFPSTSNAFPEIRFFGRYRKDVVNLLSTLILIPFISAPQILGVLYWDNFTLSFGAYRYGVLFYSYVFAGRKPC